jgi:phenylalanine-4-hydroxylase
VAVEPVVYGNSSRPPRGNYSRARNDYTCEQAKTYTPQEHDRFARLYARQLSLLEGRATPAFIKALAQLGPQNAVPRFDTINEQLRKATGWEIVAVPGLIPELPFFSLLASKRFPVTDWIRGENELDYVVEPDVFHDLFGHVPQLFDPHYADYVQAYGRGALRAYSLGATEQIARLYWYTIEFGLIATEHGLRAYGAGLLSSPGELQYAVESGLPRRVPLDLRECMRTTYTIDAFQDRYFTIPSFEELVARTNVDFAPLYAEMKQVTQSGSGRSRQQARR